MDLPQPPQMPTPPQPAGATPVKPAAVEKPPAHDMQTVRQLRVLEDRYTNIRRKVQLADEALLATEERVETELRVLTDELTELRRRLATLEQQGNRMQLELRNAASIYDIKAIEKYLSYWEPLQFVTRKEAVQLAGEKLLKAQRTEKLL